MGPEGRPGFGEEGGFATGPRPGEGADGVRGWPGMKPSLHQLPGDRVEGRSEAPRRAASARTVGSPRDSASSRCRTRSRVAARRRWAPRQQGAVGCRVPGGGRVPGGASPRHKEEHLEGMHHTSLGVCVAGRASAIASYVSTRSGCG